MRGESANAVPCPAQTLRLDRTKPRLCSAAELAASSARRTQLQTVLAVHSADRICSASGGALGSAIRDTGHSVHARVAHRLRENDGVKDCGMVA